MGLEKIEEYKRRLGMTTAELAEKSGVPRVLWIKYCPVSQKTQNLKR